MNTIYRLVKFFYLDGKTEEKELAENATMGQIANLIEISNRATEGEIENYIRDLNDVRKSECYARYELYPTNS